MLFGSYPRLRIEDKPCITLDDQQGLEFQRQDVARSWTKARLLHAANNVFLDHPTPGHSCPQSRRRQRISASLALPQSRRTGLSVRYNSIFRSLSRAISYFSTRFCSIREGQIHLRSFASLYQRRIGIPRHADCMASICVGALWWGWAEGGRGYILHFLSLLSVVL